MEPSLSTQGGQLKLLNGVTINTIKVHEKALILTPFGPDDPSQGSIQTIRTDHKDKIPALIQKITGKILCLDKDSMTMMHTIQQRKNKSKFDIPNTKLALLPAPIIKQDIAKYMYT